MKRLSIKTKVTLWYVVFMVLLAAVVLQFILSISGSYIENSIRKDLIRAVEIGSDEVDCKKNGIDIDEDLQFYQNGIYLSVYDEAGNLVEGRFPEGFTGSGEFENGKAVIRESNGERYYVYDYLITSKKHGSAWLRGVAAISGTDTAVNSIVTLAFVALPFFILLAAIGGYFITKRAFKPVVQISNTAEKISEGKDLSQRINLGEGNDEIYTLASTFDKMLDRLEDSFEAERQFTSDASHELRTPTTVILSECEYALSNAKTLEEAQESLSVILRQSKKMSQLISQLLTFARIDRGAQKIEIEEINLSELVEMVALELEQQARQKQITIKQNIESGIIIKADQTLMMRLFMNLMTNAITYGKEGGDVEVLLVDDGQRVMAKVSDNGIGIAEEHLPKIWDRFYQVNPARTASDDTNMGLGLSMVKWIVEVCGGEISVKSTLGEGTQFTIFLPK